MFSRSLLRFALALSLATALSPAHAQAQAAATIGADSPQVRYRKAYDEFRAKNWNEARRLLLELWAEAPSYDVAVTLAQVEFQLKNYSAVAGYLEYAIEHAPPTEKPDTIEQYKSDLANVKTMVGAVRVAVNVDGADILVDGQPVGTSPRTAPIYMNVGPHRVEVRKGAETKQEELDILGGSSHAVDFQLEIPAPAVATVQPASPKPAPSPTMDAGRKDPRSWVPVIAGGVITLVGVGMGVGFYFAAETNRDERDSTIDKIGTGTCGGPTPPPDCASLDDYAEDYEANRNLSTTGFIVGGVAAAGTLAYFLIARPDRDPEKASALRVNAAASTSGGAFVLSGSF